MNEIQITRGDNWVFVKGRAGSQIVYTPREGVIVAQARQIGYREFGPAIFDVADAQISAGKPAFIAFDTTRATTYEPELRQAWGEWLGANRGKVDFHALVESPLVHLGILTVNAIVKLVHSHRKRQNFVDAYHQGTGLEFSKAEADIEALSLRYD